MLTKPIIPSILRTVLVASGLLAVTACNDAPPPTSSGSSESGEPSTSTGPSVPPSSSSGLDSTSTDAGSSSGGSGSSSTDTGSTGSSSSSDASSDSGSGSTSDASSSSSTSDPSGSTGSSSSDGSSESGTTGGGTGYCAYTCMAVADCVPMGGNPADWTCNAGFCEFVGVLPPCDPASCSGDLMCAFVDGVDQCVIPCTAVGNECDPYGFECTGVTDMGATICESGCLGVAEGDPCFIQGFGQYGTCTDGMCTCTDDSECTAAGLACTA